jgi:hypothetical protein
MLLTGVLGLASLVLLARTLASGDRVRFGTLAGITLMGLAAAALTTFAFVWDLGPF